MDRIYTEAMISKSLDTSGEWEQDENGNPIVIIEASNDNLDYQEERVLRSALMNKKDYFLQNGVISYDHKHLQNPDNYKYDPEWNEEKYILGKPLDAWEGTAAKVRVLIESRDENHIWSTIGVSEDIIEASWQALADSFQYKLSKGKP